MQEKAEENAEMLQDLPQEFFQLTIQNQPQDLYSY